MRVLIAGCGYVGEALTKRLTEGGHQVVALRRNGKHLPRNAAPVVADLLQPATLRALPPGIDAVVYAASPGERTDEAYRLTYVVGLSNLLAEVTRSKQSVSRVILVTSTAVYAQSDGSWVNEAAPTQPSHFSGQRLLEAEDLLLGSPVASVAVRLAGIYGPSRTRLVDRVQAGDATFDPSRTRYTNRIHRDDCARALAHLLTLDAPAPVYVGVDDDPAPEREVLEWLAARLGVPSPRPGNHRDAPNKRCSNGLLKSSGFSLQHPTFREGYAWMLPETSRRSGDG